MSLIQHKYGIDILHFPAIHNTISFCDMHDNQFMALLNNADDSIGKY